MINTYEDKKLGEFLEEKLRHNSTGLKADHALRPALESLADALAGENPDLIKSTKKPNRYSLLIEKVLRR